MSKKVIYYRQCALFKTVRLPNDYVKYILDWAWIPEKYAVKDKVLKIKIDGEWENNWKVKEIYARASEKELNLKKDDWKRHRRVTDV